MLSDLKLDNAISKKILDNTNIFENVEPNFITAIGFGLNFMILDELLNIEQDNNNGYTKISLLFFLRWLADCLDGNVARKYQKTSDFGNKFDSFSDVVLGGVLLYALFKMLKIKMIYAIAIFVGLLLLASCKFNLFESHDGIKNNPIAGFMANNSYLYFIAYLLVIQYIKRNESENELLIY